MTNSGKATSAQMEALHGALAAALADKIRSGEFTAAELAVARQFLKDNGVDAIPTEANGLHELQRALPFQNVPDSAYEDDEAA